MGEAQVTKHDDWVVSIKKDIDNLYADGRTTLMGDAELESIIAGYRPDLKPDSLEGSL